MPRGRRTVTKFGVGTGTSGSRITSFGGAPVTVRHVTVNLSGTALAGPCPAWVTVADNDSVSVLASGTIRTSQVASTTADPLLEAVHWDGELDMEQFEKGTGIYCIVRNDTGSTANVEVSIDYDER